MRRTYTLAILVLAVQKTQLAKMSIALNFVEPVCTMYDTSLMYIWPVAPVAYKYQAILEPGMGQFRVFELPRVHSRKISWRLFLCTF